jgi:hypothetical protein
MGRQWLVGVWLILLASAAGAQAPAPAAGDGPGAVPGAVDARAAGVLRQMAETLAGMPRFGVTLRVDYDVAGAGGQTVRAGELRRLVLRRPDRLRMEVQWSDGDSGLVLYDGRRVTVYNRSRNTYLQADSPGDLDAAVDFLGRDLGMRMPLALLVVSWLPQEIGRRLEAAQYLGRDLLTAAPSDHVSARTAAYDFEVWVAQGGAPLRLMIEARDQGAPLGLKAELSDWDLAPAVPDSLFDFVPPAGAERIPAGQGGP